MGLYGKNENFYLTSQETTLKHKEEVLKLLESIQLPTEVAVMYGKAHQAGDSEQQQRNRLADEAAKRAAEKGILREVQALVPERQLNLPEQPNYDKLDLKLAVYKRLSTQARMPAGSFHTFHEL